MLCDSHILGRVPGFPNATHELPLIIQHSARCLDRPTCADDHERLTSPTLRWYTTG